MEEEAEFVAVTSEAAVVVLRLTSLGAEEEEEEVFPLTSLEVVEEVYFQGPTVARALHLPKRHREHLRAYLI